MPIITIAPKFRAFQYGTPLWLVEKLDEDQEMKAEIEQIVAEAYHFGWDMALAQLEWDQERESGNDAH